MSATILVVDDEKDILELLRYNLEKEGYKVLTARNGIEALELARRLPDLVLLDIMMPEMDGWEVCRALKRNDKTVRIPVIFLTAKGAEIDEVVGLELGADDYIQKPISMRKLIARIRRVLRHSETAQAQLPSVIRAGELEIHVDKYTVKIGPKEIQFPRKEFETLLYLATNRDRVISREKLLNAVWGENVHVVDRTVDVHIRKIREKLGKYESYIQTVKGVGYRLKV